ncbi:MAG TPA: cytochrome c oxidase subunit II [Gemmatimonadales bacterium]|nr:cytochrome c oxidase subunit II [Gemmatimonadales bacterium]
MGRLAAAALLFGAWGCTRSPSTLSAHGTRAARVAPLGWYLVVASVVVVVLIIALVLIGIFRRHPAEQSPPTERPDGLKWILYGGLVFPTVVLSGTLVWVLVVLGGSAAPERKAALTVQVIGHRWWWEVHYLGNDSASRAADANELHLPVGQPVRLELSSSDVIHSFWVPELAGKTDLIPGQTNVTWIEADQPGSYHGQCGEYCGVQHAHMELTVVAQPPAEFARWLAHQRRPADEPRDSTARAGERAFVTGQCAMCHTVQGTRAQGKIGPDLTHVGSRRTIAGGMLPNTRGNLAGWIANAQALKPGSAMPQLYLKPADLQAIVTYLQTLK